MSLNIPQTVTTNNKPFRFLDLPKDIRILVYESLPCRTTHHHLYTADGEDFYHSHPSTTMHVPPDLILILHSTPVQLLATCHQIHFEARPILQRKLSQLKKQVPRIIIDSKGVELLYSKTGLLTLLLDYLDTIYSAAPHTTRNSSSSRRFDFLAWKQANPIFERSADPTWNLLLHWIDQTATLLTAQADYPQKQKQTSPSSHNKPRELRLLIQILTRCPPLPLSPPPDLAVIPAHSLTARRRTCITAANIVAEPRRNTIRPDGTLATQFAALKYGVGRDGDGVGVGGMLSGEEMKVEEKMGGWGEGEWVR